MKMLGLCLVAGVLVAGVLFPLVGGLGVVSNQASDNINSLSSDLSKVPPPQVSTILDRDGNKIAKIYDQYRIPVTGDRISPAMKAAIVAVEDKRFYDHSGIDWQGTMRAAVHDAGGGSTQGASTITQQYVKNYLVNVVDRNNPLQQRRDQAATIARKLREAKLAMELDKRMSKDQILSGYLNVVGFGGHVYGVGAAAKVFFGTSADKLNVQQSALLAGLVNNPRTLNPFEHPKKALQRRNLVLDRMVENHSLDKAAAKRAKKQPLDVLPKPNMPPSTCIGAPDYAGFFCDYVETYLHRAGLDINPKTSPGGYTIKTTMDPEVAKDVKDAVDHNVRPTADGVANSFSVIKPGKKSHDVLAMVANRDFGPDRSKGQTLTNIVSGVTASFGWGSTFKIFTAAAALEQGKAGLNTPLPDPGSATVKKPRRDKYTHPYHVENINSDYPNPISLRDALRTSPNVAFVLLEKKVGMQKVVNMASRLGLRRTMRSNSVGSDPKTAKVPPWSNNPDAYTKTQNVYLSHKLSFTLGNSAASPLEMANVSATIKSGGVWCPPDPIESVTDRDGNKVPVRTLPCEQVISPSVASALKEGLSEDTVSGTSHRAADSADWDYADIGKTGTTEENKSVAFVGGVGNYAVSSVVFADDSEPAAICVSRPISSTSKGCEGQAFGGSVAAPPYFDAFKDILDGKSIPDIPKADPAFRESNSHGPIVPYVVYQKVDRAKSELEKAGYKVTVKYLPYDSPKGTVIGETPQGLVSPGTEITLYLSNGNR